MPLLIQFLNSDDDAYNNKEDDNEKEEGREREIDGVQQPTALKSNDSTLEGPSYKQSTAKDNEFISSGLMQTNIVPPTNAKSYRLSASSISREEPLESIHKKNSTGDNELPQNIFQKEHSYKLIYTNISKAEALSEKDGLLEENKDEQKPFSAIFTKEDLLRLYQQESKWEYILCAIIVIFWLTILSMIVAFTSFVILAKHCPVRPKLAFWQTQVGYWVNPFTFVDSNQDFTGDLTGLIRHQDYLQRTIGAGFVIIGSLFPWYPKVFPNIDVSKSDFLSIHPSLGTMQVLERLIKSFKNKGIRVVLTLDFNGIGVDHVWAKKQFLKVYESQQLPSREGNGEPKIEIEGNDYYSTYGATSGMVDLNLDSDFVIHEIKKVVQFWLSKNVDGLLLSDAAFYSETGKCSNDSWFAVKPHCTLFTNRTVEIVQEIRKVVDDFVLTNGKEKVLIADAGNTGYGTETVDTSQILLGTKERPGANLVISRYFTVNRGWKTPNFPLFNTSIEDFIKYTKSVDLSKTAFTLSSPSDAPYNSVYAMASMLLLPGTPIIYASTEIGFEPTSALPPASLYPFGQKPVPHKGVDSVLSSHLLMPWDQTGHWFTANRTIYPLFQEYVRVCNITSTVVDYFGGDRTASLLNLVSKLIKLRNTYQSLMWGTLTQAKSMNKHIEIFRRHAEGFLSFIIIFIKSSAPSTVLNFSRNCTALIPVVVHPEYIRIKRYRPLMGETLFLNRFEKQRIYVFLCDPRM